MTNLAPVSASVLKSASANSLAGKAGEAIVAGDVLYKHADGTMRLADANATALTAVVKGIALNSAAAGQPVDFVAADTSLTVGAASVEVGGIYVLAPTPGKMRLIEEAQAGDRISIVGVGVSATALHVGIVNTAAVIPTPP
jgi:hypothetical protein